MHLVLKICPNVCFYAYLDLTQNPSYNYQSLFKLKSREWWRSFINESFPPWCLWSVFIYQIRWQLLHCLSYRGCGCGHYVMKFPPVPYQLLDIIKESYWHWLSFEHWLGVCHHYWQRYDRLVMRPFQMNSKLGTKKLWARTLINRTIYSIWN